MYVSSPILVCQNNETAAMLAFSRRSDREEGREKMKTRGGGDGTRTVRTALLSPPSTFPRFLYFALLPTIFCTPGTGYGHVGVPNQSSGR